MNDESEVKMSPLNQLFTIDGKTVQIFIYENGEGGWILEVEDEYMNSTVWDESFETDELALRQVLNTIEEEGIASLIGPESGVLH